MNSEPPIEVPALDFSDDGSSVFTRGVDCGRKIGFRISAAIVKRVHGESDAWSRIVNFAKLVSAGSHTHVCPKCHEETSAAGPCPACGATVETVEEWASHQRACSPEETAAVEAALEDPVSPMDVDCGDALRRAFDLVQAAVVTDGRTAEAMAIEFHEVYERLAPSFGYETRTETRVFDPTTPNGRLMIAVCAELIGAKT